MQLKIEVPRREALCAASAGLVGFTTSWLPALAAATETERSNPKAVILLWMNGGPSTIDLWDLKPGHDNGGPFREIATPVPGMRISEHLPQLARLGSEFSIVRSMSTREGDHSRARFVATTGYTPQGAIKFPSLGSLVAHEGDQAAQDIPSYVHVGGRPTVTGGGFLGPTFAPFVVGDGGRRGASGAELTVADLSTPANVSTGDRLRRLALLSELRDHSSLSPRFDVVESIESATDRALQLMRPSAASAFNLGEERESMRKAYGHSSFGQGCLLARRLVERGVRCVEVALDGWDTHSDNFDRVKELSQTLDQGFAALLDDLKSRGLLQDTLIVCQGEFGRTPSINGQSGRDHWPASWSMVLAGAGIRGGQVVGKTSVDGRVVESKPTRTCDLMATIFQSIGLDPMKQNMSNVSRPIRLADPEGQPIEALL
ncbi:DUF1501 domain-containing protein [Roseiconus nitratireducens]|uniref:DUF1501 domain-containing protein n=1 Tax=Roseiconus nitratireducens TaxID=2605748 RepID=A0A5M6DAX5_9BACT|nr:DUF1501 domain-containing protein [Roseiconus nitratireducens]KAA5542285.1 DUF1501 domain-containing protein [Roseiconus nitratireducens]